MKPRKSTAGSWIDQAIAWVKHEPGSAARVDEPAHDGERRRHERVTAPFEAVLNIANGSLPVQGTDLHKYGAGVLSPIPIPPGSVIFIHLRAQGVVGFAHVRHCTQRGKGCFAVGLEFPSELMPKEQGPWRYERVSAT